MREKQIKNFLSTLSDSIAKENIELYRKLSEGNKFDNIDNVNDFYFNIIYPHEQFVSGLIKCEISENKEVGFILQNSSMIESNFQFWIKRKEGFSCCSDKSSTILARLVEFYKNGTRIEFDYSGEYTYHLPKTIFNTHESIIAFYEGVRDLHYGNPAKYLEAVKILFVQ